jgi:hypothetical protein
MIATPGTSAHFSTTVNYRRESFMRLAPGEDHGEVRGRFVAGPPELEVGQANSGFVLVLQVVVLGGLATQAPGPNVIKLFCP